MLCDEGKLSIKCFCGTAGLVFTLTTSQNILGFAPSHIWGASLWGPVFYFVIICISLRLFLSDEKYQVYVNIQIQLLVSSMNSSLAVCHSSNIFGIHILLEYITGRFGNVTIQGLWNIWNNNVNISLFRIPGHSMVESKFVVHKFIHFEPFTTLCLSCDY